MSEFEKAVRRAWKDTMAQCEKDTPLIPSVLISYLRREGVGLVARPCTQAGESPVLPPDERKAAFTAGYEMAKVLEAPTTRKVVQISVTGAEIHALCDEGSLWWLGSKGWRSHPPIPQPDTQEG